MTAAQKRRYDIEYRKRTVVRRRAQSIAYRDKARQYKLLRDFGITDDNYAILLQRQNGTCAICKASTPGKNRNHFCVDHDHDTLQIRGLLCVSCNIGLGTFKDDTVLLERAAQYVLFAVADIQPGERRPAINDRDDKLQRRYGITVDDYDCLQKKQLYRCALCGNKEPGGKGNFHLDHDHYTKRIRGVICFCCNLGLGVFFDSPLLLLQAATYLRRPATMQTLSILERRTRRDLVRLDRLRRDHAAAVQAIAQYGRVQAARHLGVDVKTLYNRIARYEAVL